ncbi:MAG: hypothetical protein WCV62_06705 [Candidatus Peribacteraceae bacterium]|jgi:hypothetical protein
MNIGTLYQDTMDSTRTVRPLGPDGTCEIFFDGVYCGKAKVPSNLFDMAPGSPEIGFVRWTEPEPELEDMYPRMFDEEDWDY